MDRFARDVEAAKARFPKNISEIPSHREGYRTITSRLGDKTTFFDFPPDFPFSPPDVWNRTSALKIQLDQWSPVYNFMLLVGYAQDVLAGNRQMTGWTVVPKTACAVCSKIGILRCAGCLDALYCGKACQQTDWEKVHKSLCSE
jgi:hypothetical protein